ncbi:thiamine phosphate synthase [Campylobacter sp. 19-13652]|uniref:thiamine phosphate synthase n=1 Tax=Campylobacter sp. 19-13652 TaxID=2840180 RepID=UPI001C75DDD9|nr:thiamine phosphate synthase [Campylobacter sp. 19-13652]BCX79599.1 thiamine-phosphate synthase [Campylobacter sp. 19-13652]
MSLVYAIASPDICVGDFEDRVQRLCKGGVDAIVLRAKWLSEDEYFTLALRLKKLCQSSKTRLVINHFYEVAINLNLDFWASGEWIRDRLDSLGLCYGDFSAFRDLKCGIKSGFYAPAHSLLEAMAALSLGASLLVVSPIFGASCKPNAKPAGVSLIGQIFNEFGGVKIIALGGINPQNAPLCIKSGACGVALLSEPMQTKDPEGFARLYK